MSTTEIILKTSPMWFPIVACFVAMIVKGEW